MVNEIELLAGRLYNAYCAAVGGVAYDGKPLPAWSEFGRDPAKQKQADGWRRVAAEAVRYFEIRPD
jgi:hypothetical protein